MYEVEWEGYRIGWEVTVIKFRLQSRAKLYIDGELVAQGDNKPRFVETISGSFDYQNRKIQVELYGRVGLIGILFKLKIDGQVVLRKYVPLWRVKGWTNIILTILLSWFVAIVIMYGILICASSIIGYKVVFKAESQPLDLSQVHGKIYFASPDGNLISLTPSTGSTDTLLITDSMEVEAISPDARSALLMYPKSYHKGEFPLRKVFWMTLSDKKMRLISESNMEYTTGNFRLNGSKVYFYVNDSSSQRMVIADTMGKKDTIDGLGTWSYINPGGTYFIGKSEASGAHFIFDLVSGEKTQLNTDVWPDRSDFWNWRVSLWTEDTLMIRLIFTTRKDPSPSEAYFIPIDGGKSTKVNYKGEWLRLAGNFNRRIVTRQSAFTLKYLITRKGGESCEWIYIYLKDRMVWETYSGYGVKIHEFSPDGKSCLAVNLGITRGKNNWGILGPNGKVAELPFDKNFQFLMWSEVK